MRPARSAGLCPFNPGPRNSMTTLLGPSGITVSIRITEVRRLYVIPGKISIRIQPPGASSGQPTLRSLLPAYASYLISIEPTDAWPFGQPMYLRFEGAGGLTP